MLLTLSLVSGSVSFPVLGSSVPQDENIVSDADSPMEERAAAASCTAEASGSAENSSEEAASPGKTADSGKLTAAQSSKTLSAAKSSEELPSAEGGEGLQADDADAEELPSAEGGETLQAEDAGGGQLAAAGDDTGTAVTRGSFTARFTDENGNEVTSFCLGDTMNFYGTGFDPAFDPGWEAYCLKGVYLIWEGETDESEATWFYTEHDFSENRVWYEGFTLSEHVDETFYPGNYRVFVEVNPRTTDYELIRYYSDTTITIIDESEGPSILTRSLPDGVTGCAYSAQLEAVPKNGGTVTWSEYSTSPIKLEWLGLSLTSDGVISGVITNNMPDGFGDDSLDNTTFYCDFQAAEGDKSSVRTLAIYIDDDGTATIAITTAVLPEGYVGKEYSFQLSSAPSDSVTWTAQNLPAGLKLSESGLLSGVPEEAGRYSVSFNAAKEGLNPGIAHLSLIVRGDPFQVKIPSEVVSAAPGITYYLKADMGEETDNQDVFITYGVFPETGEEISANLYTFDSPVSVTDIRVYTTAFSEGKVSQLLLASSAEGESYEAAEGKYVTLSAPSDGPVQLVSLPSTVIVRGENGEELKGVSCTPVISLNGVICTNLPVRKGEGPFELSHSDFSQYAIYEFNDYDFTRAVFTDDDGNPIQEYTADESRSSLTMELPLYKADAVLSGKVVYALSGGETVSGACINYTQRLPGRLISGTVYSASDGSYSIELVPGFDTTIDIIGSPLSILVKASDIKSGFDLLFISDRGKANLDMTYTLRGADAEEGTLRYLEGLGILNKTVKVCVGDYELDTNGDIYDLSFRGSNRNFNLFNSIDDVELLEKNIMDNKGGTITITWDGLAWSSCLGETALTEAGECSVDVDKYASGKGEADIMVRGGAVLPVKNNSKTTTHFHPRALWFNISDGSPAGITDLHVQHIDGGEEKYFSFPSPERSGNFHIAVLDSNYNENFENWDVFQDKYEAAKEAGYVFAAEDITIEESTGTLLPAFTMDAALSDSVRYITLPNSSVAAPDSYSLYEDYLSFSGSIGLDDGNEGTLSTLIFSKSSGIYEDNTLVNAVVINGRYYSMDEGLKSNYDTFFNFPEEIELPCTFTAYIQAHNETPSTLSFKTSANINVSVKGSDNEVFNDQLIGEFSIPCQENLMFQVPEIVGSSTVKARLVFPADSTVTVYDGDNIVLEAHSTWCNYEGDVEFELQGTEKSESSTHFLTARLRSSKSTQEAESDGTNEVTATVEYRKGYPTLRRHYIELYDSLRNKILELYNGDSYNVRSPDEYARLVAEFDTYELLDPEYGSSLTGEECPVVFAVETLNGQISLYPGTGEDGIYATELIHELSSASSPVCSVWVLFGEKQEHVDYISGTITSNTVNQATEEELSQTVLPCTCCISFRFVAFDFSVGLSQFQFFFPIVPFCLYTGYYQNILYKFNFLLT